MAAPLIPMSVAGSSKSETPPQEAGSSWPDLLPELLWLVLLRVPSHADRVRLRAVCRSWRSWARDLPPLLPWLALRDGTFLSLPDGIVHRLPAIPANVASRVSNGGMLFLVHDDGSCSLMNPLTGDTTPQHVDQDILWFQMTRLTPLYLVPYNIHKIVVSDNIFVVSSRNYCRLHIFARGPQPKAGSIKLSPLIPDDMALFQGKLYMLTGRTSPDAHYITRHRELHVLDLRSGLQHDHQPSAQCCIPGTTTDCWSTGFYKRYYYLVVSGDRLLMVEREIEEDRVSRKRIRTRWLKVFEAMDLDLDDCGHGGWRKVDSLKGHALFVSLECSFSIPAGVGAQEDCVYFVRELKLDARPTGEVKAEDDHLCCGVYNIRDDTVAPLPTEMATVAVAHAGPCSLTWFHLPPN